MSFVEILQLIVALVHHLCVKVWRKVYGGNRVRNGIQRIAIATNSIKQKW